MRHLHPICAHCIYWSEDRTANPATAGHCHRYPPGVYVNPQTGTIVQKYPTTDHHHWCGEWNGDESRLSDSVRRLAVSHATQT